MSFTAISSSRCSTPITDERCFLPIHVYDTATSRPVAVLLRPGKTPSGCEVRRIVTVTTVELKRPGPVGIHAAATEPCHCTAASALKIRSVDREMR
jgi:hypothetical protein